MAPTTLIMLQLAEAGKIDLDAPITEYLPYFQMSCEGWEEITVRHLLLQTSGVPDSGDSAADWTTLTPELDDDAVERLVRSLADTEMLFAPGEGFEWSDVGFHKVWDGLSSRLQSTQWFMPTAVNAGIKLCLCLPRKTISA